MTIAVDGDAKSQASKQANKQVKFNQKHKIASFDFRQCMIKVILPVLRAPDYVKEGLTG